MNKVLPSPLPACSLFVAGVRRAVRACRRDADLGLRAPTVVEAEVPTAEVACVDGPRLKCGNEFLDAYRCNMDRGRS